MIYHRAAVIFVAMVLVEGEGIGKGPSNLAVEEWHDSLFITLYESEGSYEKCSLSGII